MGPRLWRCSNDSPIEPAGCWFCPNKKRDCSAALEGSADGLLTGLGAGPDAVREAVMTLICVGDAQPTD